MHVGNGLAVAIIALLALACAAAFLSRGSRGWLSHITAKPLLSPNEVEFFHRLQRALPAHLVFPQVALGAILDANGKLSSKLRMSVRNRFDRKYADFVICERGSLKVLALIELDDQTHLEVADRRRDEMTAAAGYKTLRFRSRQKPSEAEIATLFQTVTSGEAPRKGNKFFRLFGQRGR